MFANVLRPLKPSLLGSCPPLLTKRSKCLWFNRGIIKREESITVLSLYHEPQKTGLQHLPYLNEKLRRWSCRSCESLSFKNSGALRTLASLGLARAWMKPNSLAAETLRVVAEDEQMARVPLWVLNSFLCPLLLSSLVDQAEMC